MVGANPLFLSHVPESSEKNAIVGFFQTRIIDQNVYVAIFLEYLPGDRLDLTRRSYVKIAVYYAPFANLLRKTLTVRGHSAELIAQGTSRGDHRRTVVG